MYKLEQCCSIGLRFSSWCVVLWYVKYLNVLVGLKYDVNQDGLSPTEVSYTTLIKMDKNKLLFHCGFILLLY